MSPVKSLENLTARVAGKKDKFVVEIDEAEKLPPGWTKEMRKRKSGSATKVDRFYTDPVTGCVFRSLKDAKRYLKTGKLGRLAIKPKNNGFVDMDNEDERLHMEDGKERSESNEQMSEALIRKRPLDKPKSKFSETSESELLQRASKPKRIARDSPVPSPPVPEPKTHQATQLNDIIGDTPPQPSPLPPEPKTRQANRVSGIIENDQQSKADNITDKHTENADMDNNNNNNNQEETIIPLVNHESNKKQEHNKEIEMGPTTLLTPEDQPTPTVSNPIVDSLWTDPCIEFAVKTLTGAIPLEVLTDPCVNPRAPHLPETGMSFCQTGVLSKRFETRENKQQHNGNWKWWFTNIG